MASRHTQRNTPHLPFEGGLPRDFIQVKRAPSGDGFSPADIMQITRILGLNERAPSRLKQMVRFGGNKPKPLESFVLDLSRPETMAELYDDIINSSKVENGVMVKTFDEPRFIILRNGCFYTHTGGVVQQGELAFHATSLGKDSSTLVQPALQGYSKMAREINNGNIVILAASRFTLDEMPEEVGILGNDRPGAFYRLAIEDAYFPVELVPKSQIPLKFVKR